MKEKDLSEGPMCVVYASLSQYEGKNKKHCLETSVINA